MIVKKYVAMLVLFALIQSAHAATETVKVAKVAQLSAGGHPIGSVTFTDTQYGLLIEPKLKGLTPGVHGFHIHETPSCDNFGMAARGHYDPNNTGKHLGPYNDNGHLGDLPALIVDHGGNATLVILAPRVKLSQIGQRALMIHLGGDNYSDVPHALGGGGDRIACGIIK